MKALKATDTRLRNEGLGEVWKADLTTHAKDLVAVRLVKARDPGNAGGSIPVVLFDYDVNVTVHDERVDSKVGEISAGAKLIEIFNFGAKAEGESKSQHSEREIQNLKFTVPVAMPRSADGWGEGF